jgi:hypothetical protein
VIEMIMVIKGNDEMIPFIITAGKPSITVPALIAVGCILALYIFIIILSRIRRFRKKKEA